MTTIIIPARMASSRMPGKPMQMLNGRPMVQWTVEAALRVDGAKVFVATENDMIANAAIEAGALVVRSDAVFANGSERVAHHLAREFSFVRPDEPVVNWQCDAPCVMPEDVAQAAWLTEARFAGCVVTLGAEVDTAAAANAMVGRVVVEYEPDHDGRAVWFARGVAGQFTHLGIYVAMKGDWLHYAAARQSAAERRYDLEQLRWLAAGVPVKMLRAAYAPDVNTRSDVPAVEHWLRNRFRAGVSAGSRGANGPS